MQTCYGDCMWKEFNSNCAQWCTSHSKLSHKPVDASLRHPLMVVTVTVCCLVIPTSCYQQQHGRLMTGILYCCTSFLEAERNLNHSFLMLHTFEFITVECTLGNLSVYCCKKLNALFVIADNRHSTNKTS